MENVARSSSPLTACHPSLAEAHFPSLLKPSVCDSPSVRLAQERISKVICMGKATPAGDGGSIIASAKALPVTRMQKPGLLNAKSEKTLFLLVLDDYCKKLTHF